MKMKAAQFEEDYKNRKKKVPAKLKPRVYGVLWTGLEGMGLTEEEKQKTAIVTEQLMSLLVPFRAIVHQGDDVPITTSFTQSKDSSPAGESPLMFTSYSTVTLSGSLNIIVQLLSHLTADWLKFDLQALFSRMFGHGKYQLLITCSFISSL